MPDMLIMQITTRVLVQVHVETASVTSDTTLLANYRLVNVWVYQCSPLRQFF